MRTKRNSPEKSKVVTGEIIDIEEGIFSDGRLMLAGFQKIMEGVEDIIEGAKEIIDDITTTDATEPETEKTEENETKTEENEEISPIEVKTEDDGSGDINIETDLEPVENGTPDATEPVEPTEPVETQEKKTTAKKK